MALEIEQFNPTVADLHALVGTASLLTLPDPRDEAQVKAIKSKRIQLRDARVAIEKKGKSLREEAVAFQKAVIGKEKELVGIVGPEEDRLKALEEEAAKVALMDKRQESLPTRKEKLAAIGITDSLDEALLELDDTQFDGFYNKCVSDKNEKANADIAAREKVVKEAEDKIKREAEIEAAKEQARKEEKEKGEQAIADANTRAEQAEKDAKAKVEREAKEKEERERLEREKLVRDERLRVFLEMHGYSEETKADFIVRRDPVSTTVTLFRKIGSVELE